MTDRLSNESLAALGMAPSMTWWNRGDRPTIAQVLDRLHIADEMIDEWWERRLRGRPVADGVFYAASEAANFGMLWYALGAAQSVFRRRPRGVTDLGIALILETVLVNGMLKSLFRRRRPVCSAPRPYPLRQPLTSSFPSGHASAAMVAASLLARNSRWVSAWYALALVVALSRIHVRIHHASDVLGGIGVGLALGAVVRRVMRL